MQVNQSTKAGERTQIPTWATIFIAISPYGWGKATTRERALYCAKKEVPRGKRLTKDQIKVYAAHPETRMFGYGQWEYPQGETPTQFQPILID